MATRASVKLRQGSKSKRRSKVKALRTDAADMQIDPVRIRQPSPVNPALPMIELMGRVMATYAEIPSRLAKCRNPVEFWGEYLRLGQRLFSGFHTVAREPASSPRQQRPRKASGKRATPKSRATSRRRKPQRRRDGA
jgi:hypothetical protein